MAPQKRLYYPHSELVSFENRAGIDFADFIKIIATSNTNMRNR